MCVEGRAAEVPTRGRLLQIDVFEGLRPFLDALHRDRIGQIAGEEAGALGAAAGPGAAARADAALTDALAKFFAVAEAYPDLKANERFAQLQRDLADTENKIAYARNYYNGAVEIYNIRVQSFPGLLVARTFGFRPAEFFAADDLRGS